MLTWALCLCTFNRLPILKVAVELAIRQTYPPNEIIIVDASEEWRLNHSEIQLIFSRFNLEIELVYVKALVRSSSAQRNQAVELANSDVLFLIDDDSLMFEDTAEKVMRLYNCDTLNEIAAVSINNTLKMPQTVVNINYNEKVTGFTKNKFIANVLLNSSLFRKLLNFVLMLNIDDNFIKYDMLEARYGQEPRSENTRCLNKLNFISGYCMTVRRNIVKLENFDKSLLYYAASEDIDASYRFGRHGFLLQSPDAMLHHLQDSGGRINRKIATLFHILNISYFITRSSKKIYFHRSLFYVMVIRKIFAEFLKDLLSRRWDFPQFLGVILSLYYHRRVFLLRDANIMEGYRKIQEDLFLRYGP